jgi:hypothetical protein
MFTKADDGEPRIIPFREILDSSFEVLVGDVSGLEVDGGHSAQRQESIAVVSCACVGLCFVLRFILFSVVLESMQGLSMYPNCPSRAK